MSGCGNSGCPCGNSCKCGNGCSCGSKRSMDIQEVVFTESIECSKDGCKCGPNCSCTSCSCN